MFTEDNKIPCYYCGKPVEIGSVNSYRRVVCWLRVREVGGSNSATLPSKPLAWAHKTCLDIIKLRGPEAWDTEQDALF